MSQVSIAKVAVAAATYAIDRPYSYLLPSDLEEDLLPGMRVLVPFGRGNRRSEGLVLAVEQQEETGGRLKRILAILDEKPVLDAKGLKLALWMREWYFSTVYAAAQAMLPPGLWYKLKDRYEIAPGIDRERAFDAAGKSNYAKRILEIIFGNGGQAELSQLLAAFDLKNPKPALKNLVEEGILTLETGAKQQVGDKTEKVAMLSLPPAMAMEKVEKRRETAPMRYQVTQLLCTIGSASVKEIRYFTGASMQTMKSLEKSGILTMEEQEVFRKELPTPVENPPDLVLNAEQTLALEGLKALSKTQKPEAALLYGVTGSGKTQVYISLIRSVLEQDRQALVLVPEIALTAKLLELFLSHFGSDVAILHSGLPAGERYDEWKRIQRGQAKVVLGTRSAVFAPLSNLGLIILDEEQEGSYQSEHMLRYHARDVAKFRCTQHNGLLLLGSATPAIETMYATETGIYQRFDLRQRYNEKALPQVVIADMRQELKKGNGSGLSAVLTKELEKNFASGEQSILFLNRRGSSNMVSCGECGEVPSCPKCSVRLTYHSANGRLMCHYCGYSEKLPLHCPDCGGILHFIGFGTQRVEEELKKRYPDIEVLRMDTDTVTAARSHEAVLDRFVRKRIPILLGTQMVAKGLDFENVTLVGVIGADAALYIDNYRACERTFSLLTQVVGRAGRGEKPGRAVIQTFTPEHEVITLAAKQDYDRFYETELEMRRLRRVPPFGDLFRITISGPDEAAVLRICMNIRSSLEQFQRQQANTEWNAMVFGPAPAGILKINNRYRYQVTLNHKNTKETRAYLANLLRLAQADPATKGVFIVADINQMD